MGDDVIAVSAADVTADVFLAEVMNPALSTATGQRHCDQKYLCSHNSSTRTRCYTRYYDYFCHLVIYCHLRNQFIPSLIPIPVIVVLCFTWCSENDVCDSIALLLL